MILLPDIISGDVESRENDIKKGSIHHKDEMNVLNCIDLDNDMYEFQSVFCLTDDLSVLPFLLSLEQQFEIPVKRMEVLEIPKCSLLISYNYSKIFSEDFLEALALKQNEIINLHISYLPFNRGAHPNLWSFLEDTPKGVSIHRISAGLDRGNILFQKEIFFEEERETFENSYIRLHIEIQRLFFENFNRILTGKFSEEVQKEFGTYHRKKDLEKIKQLIPNFSWRMNIAAVKKELRQKGFYGR